MKILVAIDDSQCSQEMLRHITEMPWTEEGKFIVLSVVEPIPVDLGLGVAPVGDNAIEQSTYDDCASRTARACIYIRNKLPSNHVEAKVLTGHPSDQIVKYAEAIDADLILMGSHGRSGFKKFLLGSVAEEVTRKATCSVGIIKARNQVLEGEEAMF
ncbi:MAG: universal stress protein [Candidatus Obscuribacterales bacterium]